MPREQYSKLLTALVVMLVALCAVLGYQYLLTARELERVAHAPPDVPRVEAGILDFTALFVEKVLNAQGEVSFEDRLKLETAVQELGDTAVLDQWNAFVESASEAEAQEEVKRLLLLLVRQARGGAAGE